MQEGGDLVTTPNKFLVSTFWSMRGRDGSTIMQDFVVLASETVLPLLVD